MSKSVHTEPRVGLGSIRDDAQREMYQDFGDACAWHVQVCCVTS